MKLYFILIVFFLLIIFGCSGSKRDDSVTTIMLNNREITVAFLNKLKSDTTTIPISSLVEGFELVQLEYTEEALFRPDRTMVTNNYIGIIQDENFRDSYKLFSRSGKFLCNVGSVGPGPGEYFIINDAIIDEQNELIYLAPLIGSDKILMYNTSDIFLRNIEIPQRIISPIIFLSDNILTIVYIPLTEDKSMVMQINIHTEQVLNEFTTQIPQTDRRRFRTSQNMKNYFDINHGSSDTIHHFDILSSSIKPIFITSDNFSEEVIKHHVQLNKDLILNIIPKRGLVATDIKNKKSSWVKVKNDYFGNLDTQISVLSFNNGYYVYNIQPEQLIEEIEQRLTESTCSEKDRQMLLQTLTTLKEDKNNVVFIGKLKHEIEKNLF